MTVTTQIEYFCFFAYSNQKVCIFTIGKNAYSVFAYFWLFYAGDVKFAWLHRGYAFFMRSFTVMLRIFYWKQKGQRKMIDYKRLYFHLFGKVADVIEDYKDIKTAEPLIQKLIEIELETEDMYMDMPSDEDEVEDDESFCR